VDAGFDERGVSADKKLANVHEFRNRRSRRAVAGAGEDVKESSRKNGRRREQRKKPARSATALLKWGLFGAILLLVVYGLSQMSGIAYTDRDISVVNFSTLSSQERRSALRAANGAGCSCGCRMTLAQCVSTDSTCPIREANIERIKTIVREADRP
jgi:hypothetical protein